MSKKIAISAVEPSGDLLATSVIKALDNQAEFFGLAGPKMQTAGCKPYWHIDQVSVLGFIEVLKKLPSLLILRKTIIQTIIHEKPHAFIGVDGPDFNFFIEKKLKQHGIKTVHFISPSLWAWRAGRVKKIKKSTDLMLCLFPFEVNFYHQHNINAVFVGHPLADQLTSRKNYQKTQQILLMPGSRSTEIRSILPSLLSALGNILTQHPHHKFVISLANDKQLDWVNNQVKTYGLSIDITINDAQEQLRQSDLVLIASGTATLEAMIIGVPMVVVYKTSWLTYQIVKRLLTIKWISLPNILAQKNLVPELLQHQVNGHNISQKANQLLADDNRALINEFNQLRQCLIADTPKIINDEIQALLADG